MADISRLALDAVQKKIPGERFQGPDAAQKNRAMNEKITDFIRKQFEKMTGYDSGKAQTSSSDKR